MTDPYTALWDKIDALTGAAVEEDGEDFGQYRDIAVDYCHHTWQGDPAIAVEFLQDHNFPVSAELQKRADEHRMTGWFYAYRIDRAYGGPEEGGWWFDTGELVYKELIYKGLTRQERAERLTDIEIKYPHTGKSNSVLGGDDFRVGFSQEEPANFYPEERPHYE